VEKLANYLKERVPIVPQIGIICGTGLGKFILYLYSRKPKNPTGCTTLRVCLSSIRRFANKNIKYITIIIVII
jgi:purine nucleoside phosphorylase